MSVRSVGALSVRLLDYGYGSRLHAPRAVAPTGSGNRVLYRHGSVNEWYVNGPVGLEQGFTIAHGPASAVLGH